ncbi:MAG: hypothetical protein IIZ38_15030 [Sphingomonas sp.]|uniref:hypothetical protein n=1 Tax=Sphingomonas sp. TaxID=28214 RepID=UPI0025E8BD95|nr:hypothetical protein [Sphingomonas sp.]MBQ1499623.1 hypothetical protein [Sphingomonas sp.]MBQ8106017.1 hypothetical protein [Afipia sp.]
MSDTRPHPNLAHNHPLNDQTLTKVQQGQREEELFGKKEGWQNGETNGEYMQRINGF